MSDAASRLPNLYQLLGLPALEDDKAKIEQSVQRLLGRIEVKQRGSSGHASPLDAETERIKKVAALAQKYLLDPNRKPAYDEQWRAIYQTRGASTKARGEVAAAVVQAKAPARAVSSAGPQARVWDTSRLEQLLPPGDPQVPFDSAEFLRTSEVRDTQIAESDLDKLVSLLTNAASNSESTSPAGLGSSNEALLSQATARSTRADEHLPMATSDKSLHSRVIVRAGSFSKRLQQKRRRALLAGGLILSLGIVLLVVLGVFLMSGDPQSPGQQLASNAPTQANREPSGNSSANDLSAASEVEEPMHRPVVGSGLPQPGQGNAMLEIDRASAEDARTGTAQSDQPTSNPVTPAAPAVQVSSAPATNEPVPARNIPAAAPDTNTPASTTASLKPVSPETSSPPTSSAAMPSTTSDSNSSAASVPAADAKLTPSEKQAWKAGMNEVKAMLGRLELAEAKKKLTDLKESAQTGLQHAQLGRLEQVAGLVKEIRQAIAEAIAGLSPADTFTVGGSTTASFIDGNESEIIVRVSGKRRSYRLEEMPLGMALALVDLKMDVANANSLAAKGAYIMVHPKNQAAMDRGEQMLREAAAAGAITPELAKFYEDDYALAELDN